MDSGYIITSTGSFVNKDELYHWGIKGMKWGIRRYQNPDGSLTAAGRKRYTNSDGSLNEKGKKKFGDSYNPNPQRRKTVSEMTDEELNAAIARARKEDEYNRLRPAINPEANTKAKSKAMSRLIDDMVVPAIVNSGRNALQNALDKLAKQALADKIDPNSYDALKKEYDKLKLKKDLEELKNPDLKAKSWDDKLKQQQYEQNVEKYEREKADREAKEAAARERAAAAERVRRQRARDQRESYVFKKNDKYDRSENRQSSVRDEIDWDDWKNSRNESSANRNSSNDSGKYTVTGKGTSTKNNSGSNASSRNSNIVWDSDKVYKGADGYYNYANTPVTDLATTRNTTTGRDWLIRYYNNSMGGYSYYSKDRDR